MVDVKMVSIGSDGDDAWQEVMSEEAEGGQVILDLSCLHTFLG